MDEFGGAFETAAAADLLGRFVELQQKLVSAFRAAHSDVRDWTYLLDAPRTGTLRLGDDEWTYQRHGAGVRFTRAPQGVVVDVHAAFSDPGQVDAWRLSTYARSSPPATWAKALGRPRGAKRALDEGDLERWLDEAHRAGVVERVGGGTRRYRLARPPGAGAER